MPNPEESGKFDSTSNGRLTFEPIINLRWFDETPGFDEMYGTMSDIFTPDNSGEYVSVEDALTMWKEAERSVAARHGISKEESSLLGRVAFRSALTLPVELEIEINDMGN